MRVSVIGAGRRRIAALPLTVRWAATSNQAIVGGA
jgi:hypothetical protein